MKMQDTIAVMDYASCSSVVPRNEETIVNSSSIVTGPSYHPSDTGSWKPLVFACDKDAYHFYRLYARSRGFSIRIGYRAKVDSKNQPVAYPHYLRYDCYKQGLKKEISVPDGVVVHRREVTRTDCKARLMLKMNWQKGGYEITEWRDDHNHPFIDASMAHFLPINRDIQLGQKVVIDQYLSSGLSQRSIYEAMCRAAGGRHNLGFTRVDLKNYIYSRRLREIESGDAIIMLKWFEEQSSASPDFYYDIQFDENKQISSIFWADAVMRADYALFGDFVSFDTTYRTNKEYRPLGIFVGFNHHKATCIFGGALLYDETATSFKWLFDTFLKCMNKKIPVTVMTDQAPAIANAVRCVFPSAFHALCSWHIRQNAKRNLGRKANGFFSNEFNHLILYVDTEDEFEYTWSSMLYKCFDNRHNSEVSWLEFIYSSRKQWSSAWVKSYFTAGKTTTQLSEQLNALSRFYLRPQHSISQFFTRFQALVDDLRHNELKSEFQMVNRVPANKFTMSSVMVHAAQIYTPCIFDIIQKEYESAQEFILVPMPQLQRGSTQVFHVQKSEDLQNVKSDLLEEEVVEIDLASSNLTCSCRFYNNWWLLCRHILKVMDGMRRWGYEFCQRVPDHYIKERWTRSLKKPLIATNVLDVVGNSQTSYGERYQDYCGIMEGAAPRMCSSDAAYNFFHTKLIDIVNEVDLFIQSTTISSAAAPKSCAMVVGNGESITSIKLKKRRNPCTSKIRLQPEFERRHLKRKRKDKAEMKKLPTVEIARCA